MPVSPAAHLLGAKALRSLLTAPGGALRYTKARLNPTLFQGEEVAIFCAIDEFMSKYAQLPTLETVIPHFPIMAELSAPEAPGYYLDLLTNRFEYTTIDAANIASQALLKADKTKTKQARQILFDALGKCAMQEYRMQLTDFGKEGEKLLTAAYKSTLLGFDAAAMFGWPTLDKQSGGILPGDVIGVVGRPATGKSWVVLYNALCNWLLMKQRLLVVSMEMNTLAISQRIGAMYTHLPAGQIKKAQLGSASLEVYMQSLSKLNQEEGALWIMDGNLAACLDDIYQLAHSLGVQGVLIDGAYLMKHKNAKLDRYQRVAENVERQKQITAELGMWSLDSWQFNRQATAKNKKKGEKNALEDIGFSDAIGQISTMVLGFMQDESVATLNGRVLDILKGRNGETGKLNIKWDFQTTDFSEMTAEEKKVDPDSV